MLYVQDQALKTWMMHVAHMPSYQVKLWLTQV